MLISLQEQKLCQHLRELPQRHGYDFTDAARRELLQTLFRALAGHDEYLPFLFPRGHPTDPEATWSIRDAQGAVDGAEYTEAARGKPCGHIFKSGEATYRCKTCTADDTCVLCARCFDASDHEGHQVYVSVSPGNSGCCDCGDDEAWVRPVHCNIHSAAPGPGSKAAGKAREGSLLPDEILESIRMTISRALDYLIDVFSCSPEQLRLPKTEQSILEDERTSRLTSKWYGSGDLPEAKPLFALVLWNDEKHTVNDVRDQVARACKQKQSFGLAKAHEVDAVGRSTIKTSENVPELLKMAKIIEDIKLTVTIRSARDTFREQMGGTIVEWISDIAGCSVGEDNQILRRVVCEELLKPWRVGSEASHQGIGEDGLDDHEVEEMEVHMGGYHRYIQVQPPFQAQRDRRRNANNGDTTASDEDDEEQGGARDGVEEMDIDDILSQDNDGDVEMEPYESPDEALEISEATLAGYPPPPLPPQQQSHTSGRRRNPNLTPADSDSEPMVGAPALSHVEPSMHVPETPRTRVLPLRPSRPQQYWLEKPEGYGKRSGVPAHEDIWQRLRLDHLILYDLRMWKSLRIGVRDVFISTVVTIPQFKRLLGLRFAGVYTALAQLYLIADREPDHSIINLSLQMLTTPSITAEIVERGNFLTNLMAILYTFLTTRQVGYPWNVDPKATLAFEQGAVTNRRMYHFFLDMKYLLGSDHVQERIREEGRYILQFLDLVKLHQGICPNVRAVGEHLEYETEAWISASLITREINKLCRQFSEAFTWRSDEDPTSIRRAIRASAQVTIINSIGSERHRFDQTELKTETRFKNLEVFEFDAEPATYLGPTYKIVDYVVSKEPMSFHHALHYTLSWLLDRARSMPRDHLLGLLLFSHSELQDPNSPLAVNIPDFSSTEYLLALFDFPLRVCAWLAQMRAGIWVRNGITLRHQMTQYRSVSQRDVSYQRDIFLLQTALVICEPAVFLATMIDRYGILGWMSGAYNNNNQHGIEDSHTLDVVEDFVHLLIILLTDRTSLVPVDDDMDTQTATMRRDIAHVLCFKPLSFSDMTSRLCDKVQSADEFSDVLSEMTNFRPPEGLSDTGTFELKEQYIELIDPYIHHYNRNQREEAETIYKNHMAKKTGKAPSDIVFEPKLRSIPDGLFKDLSGFTRTSLFTQIIYYLLGYAIVAPTATPSIPITRVETYLQFVLQLLLVAILEDNSEQKSWDETGSNSLVTAILTKHANVGLPGHPTILSILKTLLEKEEFRSCEPKITLILHRSKQRQQSIFIIASESLHMPTDRMDTASPASVTVHEKELKKKQALERQARVMASFKEQQGKFMASQDFDWGGEDFSDLEDEASGTATEEEKVIKYPCGTCILCQEETNDLRLYGTFGFVSESTILRVTDVQDDDWVNEVQQTPENLDRSADGIRPFGVASRNRRTVIKVTSTGDSIVTERQDLGRGFPCAQTRRGPVTTGCGHIMHYSCFEVYLQATQRRHVSQIARNHPERPEFKEFMCPLCKALGNIFLPIIWKGQKIAYPGSLSTQTSFEDWISSQVAEHITQPSQKQEDQHADIPSTFTQQHRALYKYASQDFILPVASRLPEMVKSTFTNIPASQPPVQHRFQVPAFLQIQNEDQPGSIVPPSESSPTTTQNFPILELLRIYQRLRDTFRVNSIHSTFSYPALISNASEDLIYTDALANALGYSISAIEIAQRGVQSESMKGTLLDKISPQSLTHLRIFSETITSYIAIGSLRNQGSGKTMAEYLETQARQLHQLFIGHPNIFDPSTLPYDLKGIPPLLLQDPFIFLSECSACVVPALELDIHHIMRVCYIAELVRVALAFTTERTAVIAPDKDQEWEQLDVSDQTAKTSFTDQEAHNMLLFVTCVFDVARADNTEVCLDLDTLKIPPSFMAPHYMSYIYKMMSTYALSFIRKSAILMHVRYGVDLPHIPFDQVDRPELDRLSSLLKLPSLHELFASFGEQSAAGHATRSMVAGWIRHWAWAREGRQRSQTSISLSHPAIFELVGLPKNYDALTDEAIRRKCPTTGRELTDPCVCLFCGEIMCSQGVCCMTDKNKGGCNKHQLKCGGNIGLFINIRKCMVLFLNQNNGTWAVAPYLDKHGEVDPTLRRHHQLFLNPKRYDVLLRKVWLEGGIQSLIARRLEGDINNGGWETL
ncbi:RING finger domain-containing protein [Aaosphaeria arxii CBS 175.79]|uniref:E3 ubiquitin-protein ligase n=1 Tax=Aaosphaeria arxii CBS 175.79 TaxID=1450172 RepID=A0A6A5XJ91_9PLEO|nr:RING finger domain-containing protein [Aaosphaeria arxii CBS 175.79]KAF2012384.1 RING finger domain-containing protein [Aaosphaeria arxii CBS 175.79]